jgi:hypothetical protein
VTPVPQNSTRVIAGYLGLVVLVALAALAIHVLVATR